MKSKAKTSYLSLLFSFLRRIKITKLHLILAIVLFLVGLFVFWRFFDFSLWGDDWMLSFYILEHRKAGTLARLYFSLYGGQALLMDIMNHVFTFVPRYYYYVSYFLRFIASIAVYFTSYFISKNKLVSFVAGLLFITSFTGIESTNWVHNSINYLALATFLFGYIFWLKSKNESNRNALKSTLVYFLLFSLTIALAGVRTPGLIPSYIFIEALSFYLGKSTFKGALGRCAILVGIFFLYAKLSFFGSVVNFTSGQLKSGLITHAQEDPTYIFKFLLYPMGSFANMVFPSNLLLSNRFYRQLFVNVDMGIYEAIIFSIPVLVFFFKIVKAAKRIAWFYLLSWICAFYLFIRGFGNLVETSGSQVLLGILLIFFFIYLSFLILKSKYKKIFPVTTELLVMAVLFELITHALLVNQSTIESYSRYLTISSGLVAVFLSLVLYYSLKKETYVILISLLVFLNTMGVNHFFKTSKLRENNKVRVAWDDINFLGRQYPYQDRTRVFVFDFLERERDFYQTAIGFGGTYHFALENGIDERSKLVVFVSSDEIGAILKALENPVAAKNHLGPMVKDNFTVDDIYGFYLKDGRVVKSDEIIERIRRLRK